MKHKLTIGVSNASPKSRVVTYKKVSPETKVKDVIRDWHLNMPKRLLKTIEVLKLYTAKKDTI